jgi:transcription termination/antitermination protein NusA
MSNDDAQRIAQLFAQEIPEIAAGTIEIRGIARNTGRRTKVALYSRDPDVDCIVACVGGRGTRVHKVVEALGGERVDLVRWEESTERTIKNALQPLAIEDIVLHPEQQRAVVVVSKNQEPVAREQQAENQDLAGRLCGWRIEFEEA